MKTNDINTVYIFKKSLNSIQLKDKTVFIGSNVNNLIEINDVDEITGKLFEDLIDGTSIQSFLDKHPLNEEDVEGVQEVFHFLIHKKLIEEKIETELKEGMQRFDRQILYFMDTLGVDRFSAEAIQEKIFGSTIVVLGAGGVGSYVIRTLSAMGFGTIKVVDFDHVEESNISRQVYYDYRDIGKFKVDVVAEKTQFISKNTTIVPYNRIISEIDDVADILKGADLCIASVDTPRVKIEDITAKIPFLTNVPCVYGASVTNNIIIGPTVEKGMSSCSKCIRGIENVLYPENSDTFVKMLSDNYTTSLIDPINTMAASFMAMEAIKVITKVGTPLYNKSIFMKLDDYSQNPYKSSELPSCHICSE